MFLNSSKLHKPVKNQGLPGFQVSIPAGGRIVDEIFSTVPDISMISTRA